MMPLALGVVCAPLLGAVLAGFFGRQLGRTLSHCAAIGGVAVSFGLSAYIAYGVFFHNDSMNSVVYEWAASGGLSFPVGFLIDPLTALMMLVVTSVSLMVHIYTIGYMSEDPGYQRFFSYISLFTFSMLMLVMSNNFLQLFFGWEAVGLVSYLLIGFWFHKESAVTANMKAFLVNRVGDLGFLIGIAMIYGAFHTLNYAEVFAKIDWVVSQNLTFSLLGFSGSFITAACIALFIGAMGKSAQVPLHVWLPDSMEGPTPISALIHAATMVTAGVFMVTRLSPLFEHSEVALNFILCVGATTCFFMGLLGLVQNDIKRIIAYSTLSQLGYMVAALGASAYSAAMFHLMTHAFFKALLFLGAGAVIIALHHEQDIRKMGGLARALPITYTMMLLGSLALIGFPGFSGFYSKDMIIEAVSLSSLPGSSYAYFCVLSSVFVTALYSFRLLFTVFHGASRVDAHTKHHLHEVPAVVWLPLLALAIPSVVVGAFTVGPILESALGSAVVVLPEHTAMTHLTEHYHGVWSMTLHGLSLPPFWLAMAGVLVAFLTILQWPAITQPLLRPFRWVTWVLDNRYGFDAFNQRVLVPATRTVGQFFSFWTDTLYIDGFWVNGSARLMAYCGRVLRPLQSGYLYHYVLWMILGILAAFIWLYSW